MHLGISLFSTIIFCLSASLPLAARTPISSEPTRLEAANQFKAYPVTDKTAPTLSPSPAGYEPFHIEHYGRHGSRWLGADWMYSQPVQALEKAQNAGKLTPQGEELLAELRRIEQAADHRAGELTQLGARQHRGIARRMMRNFPTIFAPGNYVNANSTTVIRCILSMANAMSEITRLQPKLNVKFDASMTTQNTLNYTHIDPVAENLTVETNNRLKGIFYARPRNLSPFTSLLFNDEKWAQDSLNCRKLVTQLYDIAANRQSHDNLYNIDRFMPESVMLDEWRAKNIEAYINCGSTPATNCRPPFAQRLLLKSIIEACDTSLMSKNIGANLRYGHETVVLPLAVLMEVGGTDYETADLDSLHNYWRAYQYYPMACNLQFIFYRPKDKKKQAPENILVKVLLNEKETTLPTKPMKGNYYRWADLRDYYIKKLDSFNTRFKE